MGFLQGIAMDPAVYRKAVMRDRIKTPAIARWRLARDVARWFSVPTARHMAGTRGECGDPLRHAFCGGRYFAFTSKQYRLVS
jgi:hypothetical protein